MVEHFKLSLGGLKEKIDRKLDLNTENAKSVFPFDAPSFR